MLELGVFIGLCLLGYLCGTTAERRHYRSIEARERQFVNLPAVPLRTGFDPASVAECWLVAGCTAVSVDYFKLVAAGMKSIFGGRLTSYESLLDRARREAILRMKAEARGADAIWNVRIETSAVSGDSASGRSGGTSSVEVLAYGTALRFRRSAAPEPLTTDA